MENRMNAEGTRALLLRHCRAYPQMQAQDLLKFLYQSVFGCEHLVSSPETAVGSIAGEYAALGGTGRGGCAAEPLDGGYSRVPLACLGEGLGADTLGKLFVLSAGLEKGSVTELRRKLETAGELARQGALPFGAEEFRRAVSRWEAEGFPALHHSDAFRAAYRPAYRVIANRYIPFLPLFAALDKRRAAGRTAVAIEGGSASGKSTLGGLLEKLYGCTVFHMDDFFLQPAQRTPERLAEAGGNVDRERFLKEVLLPLRRGETVYYRKFDCSSMSLGEAEEVRPGRLTVIEGAYSMHPALAACYDLSVFLEISPARQRERILRRNTPQMAQRFFNEWIPLENAYFEKTDVKARCGLVIPVG